MASRTIVDAAPRTHRRVLRSVAYGPRGADDLKAIAVVFDVSFAELGKMFGVKGQAVQQWFHRGVPAARRAHVARVAQAARALYDFFKPERIPEIVRTPLPNSEESVIDLARRDPLHIVELVNRARSYVPA